VLALDRAVGVAVDFYNEHPEDTLIIVTGDHETGGLSIGFATTAKDTHLQILTHQTMSHTMYGDVVVKNFRAEKIPFATALKSIEENFGLVTEANKDAAKDPLLVLTPYELSLIQAAYEKSMLPSALRVKGQRESVIYGGCDPLTVTLTHVLNNKAGVGWSSYSHTGMTVPVFTLGSGAELFTGVYDNTDLYKLMAFLTGVE